MAIPAFSEHGTLPDSIHDCSLEEVEATFGRFQSSDQRMNLTQKLKEYVQELKKWKLGIELIIDGSYVTNKEKPGDIDLILVLPEEFDFATEVKPHENNLISGRAVRRIYGFDLFTVKRGSDLYRSRVAFFQKVTDNPGIEKGLLRINLA